MIQIYQHINIKKVKTIFALGIILAYIIPYALMPYIFTYENAPEITQKLITVTVIGVIAITLTIALFPNEQENSKKILLNFRIANRVIFALFILVVCIIFITAPSIPLIDSLFGNGNVDLVASRDDFLKTRVGWEQALSYIIGMLTSYIIPYFIAYSHYHKIKSRWLYTALFFLYCISFLEKAYFLKVVIPLLIIYISTSKTPFWLALKGLLLIILTFVIMFNISDFGGEQEALGDNDFFSMSYAAGNTFQKVFWRVAIVPVITAFDGLNVFISDFNNSFFGGRTSSLIAFLKGEEQINFERYLYSSQFGGNGFGNANQFYVIEAYINFGYVGVFTFSILIGYFLMKSIRSADLVYISVIPLLIYNLFNAGLIGNLFSNGYIIFFTLISIFKLVK